MKILVYAVFILSIIEFGINAEVSEVSYAYASCVMKNNTTTNSEGYIKMSQSIRQGKSSLLYIKGSLINPKSNRVYTLEIHNDKVNNVSTNCSEIGSIFTNDNLADSNIGYFGKINVNDKNQFFVLTNGVVGLFGDKNQFNIIGKSCAIYEENPNSENKRTPLICGNIESITNEEFILTSSSKYTILPVLSLFFIFLIYLG